MDINSELASAIALHDAGRFAEAEARFAAIAAAYPQDANVYFQWAATPLHQGKIDEGIRLLEQSLALEPRQPLAHYNKARALLRLNRVEDAAESARSAIALAPQFAEAYATLGLVLLRLRSLIEARKSLLTATSLQPRAIEPWCTLSGVLIESRDLEGALRAARQALAIDANAVPALLNCAAALDELGRADEGIPYLERAVALNPRQDLLLGGLGFIKRKACDWRGLQENVAATVEAIEEGRLVCQPFPLLSFDVGPDTQLRLARIFTSALGPKDPLKVIPARRRNKIRIGYFSADFFRHATAYLMAELFERHDKSRFEIHAFSIQPSPEDDMRERLKRSFDSLTDIATLSDADAVRVAREAEIDIAVDLKGLTLGARPMLFAHRVAPIQVNYLGYPGTMGASFMDYIVADPVIIPPEARQFYDEKVVTLPDCYQVNDSTRSPSAQRFTRAELGLPENGLVLCCFNQSYKLAPSSFDIWMRVVKANPSSVFWLFDPGEKAKANLRREAEARGVAAERLVFARLVSLPEHLARHEHADLCLDTFSYNAHTTASDALWCGVPFVTLQGDTFASRVCSSLLHAVGLPELVTRSREQYEMLAMELAANVERRAALRAKLLQGCATAPLFDSARFASHLEAAFVMMHERALAGLAPDHIDVPLLA